MAGGTLNGVRLFSPRSSQYVTRNVTGDRVDAYMGMPMHRGLGPHSARARPTPSAAWARWPRRGRSATAASARPTAGPTPTPGVSFAYLTNSRVPDPWHSERMDTISNLVHSAID